MSSAAFQEIYFRSADGLRLYFRDYGSESSQTPVLCLPGLTRNSRDYEHIAARLSESRRVICPDLRGRGKSDYDSNWRNYHPARYSADTWQLLDEAGIDNLVIIGTSLGGWMAMLMNHESPARVSAAVLNDIGPETNPQGIARVAAGAGRLDVVDSIEAAIEQVKSFYEVAFPDWNEAAWRRYTEITYCQADDGRYDLNFDRNIGHAAREGVSGLAADPWELFDSLADTPTLVIHGEISDILTPEIIAKMQKRKPDLQVSTVHNRGHAPLLDEQEAVDAISAFIDSI